jgi:hypothetical protein
MIAAASEGLGWYECGLASAPLRIDLTVTWWPTTALATLPHTSVDATTVAARECRPSAIPQPASTAEPIRHTVTIGRVPDSRRLTLTRAIYVPSAPCSGPISARRLSRPTHNTNENRFHQKVMNHSCVGAIGDPL